MGPHLPTVICLRRLDPGLGLVFEVQYHYPEVYWGLATTRLGFDAAPPQFSGSGGAFGTRRVANRRVSVKNASSVAEPAFEQRIELVERPWMAHLADSPAAR